MKEDCKVIRKKEVTSMLVNFGTGETVIDSEKTCWVIEPCGTPLFQNDEITTGVCRSCKEGWIAEKNYPLDNVENRELVPHYFK